MKSFLQYRQALAPIIERIPQQAIMQPGNGESLSIFIFEMHGNPALRLTRKPSARDDSSLRQCLRGEHIFVHRVVTQRASTVGQIKAFKVQHIGG